MGYTTRALFLALCICISFYLAVFMSVCLQPLHVCFYLSPFLTRCLPAWGSICLNVFFDACPSIPLSVKFFFWHYFCFFKIHIQILDSLQVCSCLFNALYVCLYLPIFIHHSSFFGQKSKNVFLNHFFSFRIYMQHISFFTTANATFSRRFHISSRLLPLQLLKRN